MIAPQETVQRPPTLPRRDVGKPANIRPVALPVLFDNIPDKLAQLKRWIVWRWQWTVDEKSRGKWKKPPYSPISGKEYSLDDSDSWGTLDQVRDYRAMGFDGIGIVLGDGLAGADLDDCMVAGQLTPLARQIVVTLASYTEVSPSGTGVKVLVFGGQLSEGKHVDHARGVELYDSGQYFTVTGHALPGTVASVEERTDELTQVQQLVFPATPAPAPRRPLPSLASSTLTDDQIIDKAMRAKNADNFAALWEGDASGYPGKNGEPDDSAADQALCNMLAFWTGKDAGAIDRLFRRSGLYRAKWDTRHYSNGDTYGQGTIAKAIKDTHAVYQGARPTGTASAPTGHHVDSTSQGLDARDAREQALRRILTSPLPEAARVLAANLILESRPAPGDAQIMGHPVQMSLAVADASIPALAARYGMTESAVQRNLSRLDQAHFLARGYDKSHTYPNGKPAPYSIITGTTIYLAGFDRLELPDELPSTKQMDTQRDKAAETRSWAAKGKELHCPCCGEQGAFQIACTACGAILEAETDENAPHVESTSSQSVPDVDSTCGEISTPDPNENDISTEVSTGGGQASDLPEAPECPAYLLSAPLPEIPPDFCEEEAITPDAPDDREAPPSGNVVETSVSVSVFVSAPIYEAAAPAPSLYDGWQRSDIANFNECVRLWRKGDYAGAYRAADLMTDSAKGERERQKRAIKKDIDAQERARVGDAIAAEIIAGLAEQEGRAA